MVGVSQRGVTYYLVNTLLTSISILGFSQQPLGQRMRRMRIAVAIATYTHVVVVGP